MHLCVVWGQGLSHSHTTCVAHTAGVCVGIPGAVLAVEPEKAAHLAVACSIIGTLLSPPYYLSVKTKSVCEQRPSSL